MNSHESTPITTESGLLPKEWQVVELRDAIEDLKNGFASGKRDENGIVQIRMNNVTTNGRLIFDSYLKVPVPENINNWLLKKGDFLFNNTNSIDLVGKSTIFNDAPFPCTFSNHFTRIRFKKDTVLPEIILYHFITLREKGYFKSVAIRHVGQSAVHTDYLLKLQIPLPPLPEQRRIAEVLGTVDSAIQKVGGAIEKTERLKKGLMQRLLTKGIGHERFKFSKELGGEVPEEWEVTRLGEVLELCQYGLSIKMDETGKYPIIKMDDIVNGVVVPDKVKYIDLDEKTFKNFKLEKGDILFNRTNSYELVGRTGIFLLRGDYVFASYLIRLKPKKEIIDSHFLTFYMVFSNDRIRQQLATRAVHQANINATNLQNFNVPLPPRPEQRRIAEILSAVDTKLELERRRKEKLERVKKGLMDELLTGRKRVKIEV